jgi:hypothetical protein
MVLHSDSIDHQIRVIGEVIGLVSRAETSEADVEMYSTQSVSIPHSRRPVTESHTLQSLGAYLIPADQIQLRQS